MFQKLGSAYALSAARSRSHAQGQGFGKDLVRWAIGKARACYIYRSKPFRTSNKGIPI